MGIELLETTLRDGNYAIDFQFTAEDTALVAAGLEKAGFRLIELGHGLGLNASEAGKGRAAASDEEYLEAASRVLKDAKFGMFFIPGIGRKDDLKTASDYGMSFVRIGTNVTEVEEAQEYVEYAKKLGFTVTSNLMKSYVLPLEEFVHKAKLAESYGVDIIYLVDSAGGMLPEDVRRYITALREETRCEIGFHGHDNLNLAIANTLEAIKYGATYVDSSLQGMGRSGGNAQTEVLIVVLDKLGYHSGVDIFKTMALGERLIRPLLRERHGVDSIAVVSGYAEFHSSFLSTVYKTAKMYNLDPRELIVEVSQRDKVHVTDELALETAKEIIKDKRRGLRTSPVVIGDIDLSLTPKEAMVRLGLRKQARRMADQIASISLKKGKESIFTIAMAPKPQKGYTLFPFIQENMLYVIGNAEIGELAQLEEIIPEIDGKIHTIAVDVEEKWGISGDIIGVAQRLASHSRVLSFKDSDLVVRAIDSLVARLCPIYGSKVTISGADNLSLKLALKLAERGGKVVISTHELAHNLLQVVEALNQMKLSNSAQIEVIEDRVQAAKSADLIIGMTAQFPSVSREMIEVMKPSGIVLDGVVGSITPEGIDYAHKQGLRLLRLDIRAALMGEIVEVTGVDHQVSSIMGQKKLAEGTIVSGGIVGKKGDIVVDSVSEPSQVIGVANGMGGLLRESTEYRSKVERIRARLRHQKLASIFQEAGTEGDTQGSGG